MADFTQIIQEINADINTNGVGAITGAKLNEVLRDMIAAVNAAKTDILPDGALYGGFVRPDEPPTYGDDYRYYYLAEENGEYIYFNRLYVDSNVSMFYYDTELEVWRQKVLWIKNVVLDGMLQYKAGKPVSSTQGHIPNLDQYGDLEDSGIAVSDIATNEDVNGVNLLVEQSSLTDQQRNTALANVSNQTANSTTGKMGYKVLDPTKTFASQVTAENTIYEIRDVFNLNNGSITIPAGSVLKNNGGVLKNCTVTLNNTSIQSDTPIFGENVVVTGNTIQEASPEWFTGSDADKIQRAIECFSSIRLSPRTYNIDRPIIISQSFAIRGSGYGEFFGTNYPSGSVNGRKSILRAADTSESHIDCILWVVGVNAPDIPSGYTPRKNYVSALIEGVCFAGARRSNGINWSTPGGPSRPITIKNCSFSSLNHGLHIYGSTSSYSTNFGDSYFNQSVFDGCVWGIYAIGRHAVSSMNIENCLLEGNHNDSYTDGGAINMYDDENYYPLFGALIINQNQLEGNVNGIKIKCEASNISLKSNYFEWGSHDQNNTILGNLYGTNSNKVIIDNEGVTSSEDVYFYITNCTVEFASNSGEAYKNNYILDSCKINTNVVGNLLSPNLVFVEHDNKNINIIKDSDVVTTFTGRPSASYEYFNDCIDTILEKHPSFANASNYNFNLAGSETGVNINYDCVLVFYAINTGINNALIINQLSFNNTIPVSNGISVYNVFFPASSFNNVSVISFQFRRTSGNLFVSTPILVKNNSNKGLLGYNLGKYVGKMENILNADNTSVWPLGDIAKYNGKWVDGNGNTYTKKVGTTSERPTDLDNVHDVGYQYFDKTLGKYICAANFSASSTDLLTKTISTGETGECVQNTLVYNHGYNLSIGVNVSYTAKMAFRKTNDNTYSSDDEIVISSNLYNTTKDFIAPNPIKYPYIYFYNGRPAGNTSQTFKVKEITYDWVNLDGTALS